MGRENGRDRLSLAGNVREFRQSRGPAGGRGRRLAMAVAELTLFGSFAVRAPNEAAINLLGQKERALLAFLALSPGTTHSRDKLASLLWSDRGDPQARDSLKHA